MRSVVKLFMLLDILTVGSTIDVGGVAMLAMKVLAEVWVRPGGFVGGDERSNSHREVCRSSC